MKNITCILLFLFGFLAFSQERAQVADQSSPKIVAVKTGHFFATADSYMGNDNFGFQYFIKDNAFIKTNGKDKVEFQKLSFGRLTRADIQNPLLIVLFYESINAVVLLDNQLNEVRSINFNELPTPIIAQCVGLASQNRLWVYDSLTQQIGLFDYLKNTYQILSTPLKDGIKYCQADFNHFQWADSKSSWFACDLFGKITELGKLPDFDQIYFTSNQYYVFSKSEKIFVKNLKNNTIYSVSGIDNSYKKFYAEAQNLSIFTSSGITNYKIILP